MITTIPKFANIYGRDQSSIIMSIQITVYLYPRHYTCGFLPLFAIEKLYRLVTISISNSLTFCKMYRQCKSHKNRIENNYHNQGIYTFCQLNLNYPFVRNSRLCGKINGINWKYVKPQIKYLQVITLFKFISTKATRIRMLPPHLLWLKSKNT